MPVPTSSPSSFGSSQTANPTVESDQSQHSSVEANTRQLTAQPTEDIRKPKASQPILLIISEVISLTEKYGKKQWKLIYTRIRGLKNLKILQPHNSLVGSYVAQTESNPFNKNSSTDKPSPPTTNILSI